MGDQPTEKILTLEDRRLVARIAGMVAGHDLTNGTECTRCRWSFDLTKRYEVGWPLCTGNPEDVRNHPTTDKR